MARDSTPCSIAARTMAKDVVNHHLDDTITASLTTIMDQSMAKTPRKVSLRSKQRAVLNLTHSKTLYL